MYDKTFISLDKYFSQKLIAYAGESNIRLKPTHAHEIVASYLGYKSYAALLELQKKCGAFLYELSDTHFNPNYSLLHNRITQLLNLSLPSQNSIITLLTEILEYLVFCEKSEKFAVITKVERCLIYSKDNDWGSVLLHSKDMEAILDYFSDVSDINYEEAEAFNAMAYVFCNRLPSDNDDSIQVNIDFASILLERMKRDILPELDVSFFY